VNIADVQAVAGRVPSDHSQEGFDYHYDVDRDGDVDSDDGTQMAQRWQTDRACCPVDAPQATATLHVDAPDAAAVDEVFTADVALDDAAGLGGLEFELTFDPAVLQVQTATAGSLLSSGGRTAHPLGPVVDNTNGRIIFGGYTEGPG